MTSKQYEALTPEQKKAYFEAYKKEKAVTR